MSRGTLLLQTALTLLLGLVVMALGLSLAGHDAGLALGAMFRGAFGSWFALTSATLPRSVPLIILGFGFALAFRAGALNIGGEGQFLAGAIAATWVGLSVGSLSPVVAIPSLLLAATVAGMLWIVIPVWLRIRFGVLEVISTLLLNFVAAALVSLVVQGPLQEPLGIYPQSDLIAASARLPLLPGTRLHLGFPMAVVLAGAGAWIFSRTIWGFRLRAVGDGPRAARIAGRIKADRLSAIALLLSGGIAGLAGGVEIAGVTRALFQNLSPGYGFTAIAVALLARGHPIGILGSGLLFGALAAGAGAMQREAGVPAVAVHVVEAVVIVTVLLADALTRSRRAEASRA